MTNWEHISSPERAWRISTLAEGGSYLNPKRIKVYEGRSLLFYGTPEEHTEWLQEECDD